MPSTLAGREKVRDFLRDLNPVHQSPLFEELHNDIRELMLGFAKTHGYTFTPDDLENVLWEYGLGHDQLEIHSKSRTEAEKKIDDRFAEEDAHGQGRGDTEKNRIRDLVRDNVGKWRHDPHKKVDEHAAWVIVHSAAN